MYGEHRFALAPNEQKAFKGFFEQAFVNVSSLSFFYFFFYGNFAKNVLLQKKD